MTDKAELSPAQRFLEDMGDFFDRSGHPRILGRVLGWLLISDPPHQSASDLAQAVGASKGSISTTTRTLLAIGVAERMGLPGERKTFYRIKSGAWSEVLRKNIENTVRLRKLAAWGLEELNDLSDSARERLEELHDLYTFCELEFPAFLERWEQVRAQRKAARYESKTPEDKDAEPQ